MKRLSGESFDLAAEYIAAHARPLEKALFAFHFQGATASDVLVELAKFQNDDGGFGHGIEPDFRMPDSSPLASSVAFQVLTEVETPTDHPLVAKGIAYFASSFDRAIGGWDPTGSTVDQYPHAPWWNYEPIDGELDLLKRSNPGAEIVGYLRKYGESASDRLSTEAEELVLNAFSELPDDMEMHVMLCFMRLAEMSRQSVRDRILPKLERGVTSIVGRSPEEWTAYSAKPLWFAPEPRSLLAGVLEDAIHVQLDYEIESQRPNGSWEPNWNWGQYEDHWSVARTEWSGYLTLRNLLAFRAWDRLDT